MLGGKAVLVDEDTSSTELGVDDRGIAEKTDVGIDIADDLTGRDPIKHMQKQRRRASPAEFADAAVAAGGAQGLVLDVGELDHTDLRQFELAQYTGREVVHAEDMQDETAFAGTLERLIE